jgi:hypothetical protein
MVTESNPTQQATRLIPLTEWVLYHPWPPLGGMRHLVFRADANGFSAVVRRVGGRVLIDEAAFFTWVESQNADSVAGLSRATAR